MNQDIRDALCDMGHEEAVIFDGPDYDEAIIGVTEEFNKKSKKTHFFAKKVLHSPLRSV